MSEMDSRDQKSIAQKVGEKSWDVLTAPAQIALSPVAETDQVIRENIRGEAPDSGARSTVGGFLRNVASGTGRVLAAPFEKMSEIGGRVLGYGEEKPEPAPLAPPQSLTRDIGERTYDALTMPARMVLSPLTATDRVVRGTIAGENPDTAGANSILGKGIHTTVGGTGHILAAPFEEISETKDRVFRSRKGVTAEPVTPGTEQPLGSVPPAEIMAGKPSASPLASSQKTTVSSDDTLMQESLHKMLDPNKLYQEGARGKDVMALQTLINAKLKELNGPEFYTNVDGIYGERTALAVRSIQYDLGLKIDGKVGPETMAALMKSADIKGTEPR